MEYKKLSLAPSLHAPAVALVALTFRLVSEKGPFDMGCAKSRYVIF